MEIKFPAVSIIIPMYNAEKYIGECLESILAQTFPYYEVIVADDCSTDNSVKIAESYLRKFGGRLKIANLKKNSGNPSTPRNIGIEVSRGEYIMFVDSDDAITPTAIEELYIAAKKLDADILFFNSYYKFFGKNLADSHKKQINFLKKMHPVEILANPLSTLLKGGLSTFAWLYLYRREFILENNIKFHKIAIGEDRFFVFESMFFAKKVFRIPNACYYHRMRDDSVSSRNIPPEKLFAFRVKGALGAVNFLNDFISEHERFFEKYPQAKFLAFNHFVNNLMNPTVEHSLNKKVSVQDRMKIILKEMEKVEDKNYLTAFLLNKLVDNRTALRKNNLKLNKVKKILNT